MSDELQPLVSKRETAARQRWKHGLSYEEGEQGKPSEGESLGGEPQWVLNCRREPDPDFGPFIKDRRRALNLTQEELAWRAGITRRHMYNVECGKRRCSYQLAQRLSGILGVQLVVPPPELPSPDPLEPTWRDAMMYHNVWQRSDENKLDPRRPRREYRKLAASQPASKPLPLAHEPGFGTATEREFKQWQLRQPRFYRVAPEVRPPRFG